MINIVNNNLFRLLSFHALAFESWVEGEGFLLRNRHTLLLSKFSLFWWRLILLLNLKRIDRFLIFSFIIISKMRRSSVLYGLSILIRYIVFSTHRLLIDLFNNYFLSLECLFPSILSFPNFLITSSSTLAIPLTKISSVLPTLDLWNIRIQLNLLFKLFAYLDFTWILR